MYTREQIEKEREATDATDEEPLGDSPWRLIGIKGQSVPYEIPMYVAPSIHPCAATCHPNHIRPARTGMLTLPPFSAPLLSDHAIADRLATAGATATSRSPITIMRNELISQGGSGVPIDRDAYMRSVDYWKAHATVL